MSLRWKTYLIVVATLITSVAAIFVLSQTVLMRSFAQVESDEVQKEVARARAALNQESADLDAVVYRYSSWDDTVAFLEGRNQAYPETDLADSFFTGSGVNLVVLSIHQNGSNIQRVGIDRCEVAHPRLVVRVDVTHSHRSSNAADAAH